MDPARWKQIDELLDAALGLPDGDREAFVAERAAGDEDLCQAVLKLLAAQKKSEAFLDRSAMRTVAVALAADMPFGGEPRLLGQTIATYKIESMIGAGGMGEVYLATDEKLHRRVALKVLPPEYGSNDERVKRFEQEARAISKLNHPGIVTVYDVGLVDGVNYIATEFVEGKNLRDLIGRNFKIRNILLNSIQICDALLAAHSAGIIHRDIKPENIMIRRDGYAKILDFGLAKLTDTGDSPEFDPAKTTKGMLIGTPAYMSPEQISGDPVDHRTDLWSCGVVLYEFLTGTNPFKRPTRQATLQAIVAEDPPPASTLNAAIPEDLDRLLVKALIKNPDESYQSAAELRADLKRILREMDSSSSLALSDSGARRPPRATRSRPAVWAAGTAALLIAAGAIWYLTGAASAVAGGTDWAKAENVQLTNEPGTEYFPSLAPDGKSFVYAGEREGDLDIYLKRVGGRNATNLTESPTTEETQPAFSPNGEQIAFRSDRDGGGIFIMGTSRENPRRITDFGYHPAWSPDGTQLAVTTFGRDRPTVRDNGEHGIYIVDVSSGERRKIATGLASLPAWSPNGKRVAFWIYGDTIGRSDIATVPAEGGEPVILTTNFGIINWNAVWSPDGGFLYFVSNKGGNHAFWRIAIDQDSGRALSEPEPVANPSRYSRHLSFSRDGKRMLYVQTDLQSNLQGVEFDAAAIAVRGKPFWITEGDREVTRAELSPDGTRFQMRQIRRTRDDIVTVSRDGKDWRDITDDEPFDRFSRWSPDGKQIAFSSDRSGAGAVWVASAEGTNLRQITADVGGRSTGFPVWSPDGRRLAFSGGNDVFILDPSRPWSEQTPEKLPAAPEGSYFVAWDWSPDGKHLAGTFGSPDPGGIFFSFEDGTYRRFYSGEPMPPSWLPDSRHALYSKGSSVLVADRVTLESRRIFTAEGGEVRSPFVSRDGKLLYYVLHRSESDIWLLDLSER